ncbi:hypothetical protein LPYR103PRE_13250 [Segatella asaccharophila]
MGDGVIAEIEIFHVYAAPGITDGLEKIFEFLPSGFEEDDGIIMCEFYAM